MAFGDNGEYFLYTYDNNKIYSHLEDDKTRFFYSKDYGETWRMVYDKDGIDENPICDMMMLDGNLLALRPGDKPTVEVHDVSGLGAIGGVAVDNGDIRISVTGNRILVEGLDEAETVSVYDMNGRVVYSGRNREISAAEPGIYAVKAGDTVRKVSLR